MNLFVYCLLQLPYNLARLSFRILSQKISLTFSSAPGSTKPYDFGEYKADATVGFIPSVGDMIFGITCISTADTLLLGVITDKYCLDDPDMFMKILNRRFRKFVVNGDVVGVEQIQESKNAKM